MILVFVEIWVTHMREEAVEFECLPVVASLITVTYRQHFTTKCLFLSSTCILHDVSYQKIVIFS